MASIRSSPDQISGGRGTAETPVWWTRLVLVGSLLLLAVGVLRAFSLAESAAVPRSGIGEVRWHGFATRPDLHDLLDRWLKAVDDREDPGLGPVRLGGTFDLSRVPEADRVWLMTMLRYACPRSVVELDVGALRVEPSCRPEFPEFLETGRSGPSWMWLVTMASALLLGLALTDRRGVGRMGWSDRIVAFVLAWVIGWTALALLTWLVWIGGLRGVASWIWSLGPLIAFGMAVHRRRTSTSESSSGAPGQPGPRRTVRWSPSQWASLGTAAILALTSTSKVLRSDVWSWDYVAVWGFRARKIAEDSLEFLRLPGFDGSNPDYPLGVAFSWLVGTAGQPPTGGDVRLVTLLMLAGLAALLFLLFDRFGVPLRLLLVAAMLSGPLAWDTEGLGLAELPLVFWATGAVMIWASRNDAIRYPEACSLLLLVMVAWTKQEGFVVAAALGIPGAIWVHGRRGIRGAGVWFAGLVGALGVVRVATDAQTPHGTSFLEGGAWTRVAERVRDPGAVLSLLPSSLFHPQWIVWFVVLGLLAATWFCFRSERRSDPSSGPRAVLGPTLVGVSTGIVGSYVLVYFATYLEPADHVATSWHRILAPALWIFILGVALSASARLPSCFRDDRRGGSPA